MMLFHDRRHVRLKSRSKSCIPQELWDRDFHKFSCARCIYCNGQYDDYISRTLSLFVKPEPQRGSARWLAKPPQRKKQKTLQGWRVQKRVARRVREASPNSIYRYAMEELEPLFVEK